jgi:cytochrome c peroxidase
MKRSAVFPVTAATATLTVSLLAVSNSRAFQHNNNDAQPNPSGAARTFSRNGFIDLNNPFFQDIGANGRRCVTCHQPSEGWGISAAGVQARFEASGGTDPIFRLNDGSNSPAADVSTVDARRQAYSMLLSKGLIRVGLPVPGNAEFELVGCEDPYNFATSTELSLFRRPLPTTNLRFLTTVMWDGRESHPGNTLEQNLLQQSDDATTGHAQLAGHLTPAQRKAIVAFQMDLCTAQAYDNDAGNLAAEGGKGGPIPIMREPFYLGINDVLGADPTGKPFDPNAMTLYSAWSKIKGNGKYAEARRAVARGEALFNNKPIAIAGVKGLNDDLGIPVINGTCTSCHDSPNVGNHSLPLPIDIGLADASRRTSDMPLYTLRKIGTGETVQTTDPGRALVTGKWKDIGKFKGPILRGLAARAPYFHNGSAADLNAVIEFYDDRFGIGFTAQEKKDLVAFLKTL